MIENRIPVLEGADTRSLVKAIRSEGECSGLLVPSDSNHTLDVLREEAMGLPSMVGQNLARQVSARESYFWASEEDIEPLLVIAYDFGIKYNILRSMNSLGINVTVVPWNTSSEEILEMNPAGVFLSNGPGDPAAVQNVQEAVRELAEQKPLFGICLGHQLLACAYGAKVGPGDESEVGVMPVRKTVDGKRSAFLRDLPDSMDTLQWHSAEVKTVPEGFQVLAESDRCAIQSLSYGDKVFSVQYHQEITETTVLDWSKISEYKISLEKSLGKNAVQKLEKDVLANIDKFIYAAKLLYRNWKSTAFEN